VTGSKGNVGIGAPGSFEEPARQKSSWDILEGLSLLFCCWWFRWLLPENLSSPILLWLLDSRFIHCFCGLGQLCSF